MIKQAFIGIDLGTSGCRVMVMDQDGAPLLELGSDLPPSLRTASGKSRQTPADWWQAVLELLRQVPGKLPGYRSAALAVDGTSSTLLLADAAGNPLTPALMYDDTSAREYCDRIAQSAPPESSVQSAGSSLAKLLLLADEAGTKRACYALHQADWISGMLCGRFGFSDENNCLKLGYDALNRRWPEWMKDFDFPGRWLPQVVPAGSPVGCLSPEIAGYLNFPEDTRVVAGTTDSTAAVLASGIDKPGQAVTSLGSTLVLKILSEKPLFAPEHGIYSQRLGDLWLVGGASNSGGAVLKQLFSDDEILRLSRQIDPNRNTGLDYYPLPAPGERFPVNDPGLMPRLEPRPADDARFLQGILEGISHIEAEGYRLLQKLGAPQLTEVFSIGGGAGNEPWRLIRERRIGVPVYRCEQQQAAYGSARLALNGCRP